MAVGLAVPGQSQGWYLSTLNTPLAKKLTYKLLRESPVWRYRSVGYVDCNRGRIDRLTIACRILIVRHHTCWRGRSRVHRYWNYHEQEPWVSYAYRFAPKYRCVGVNY